MGPINLKALKNNLFADINEIPGALSASYYPFLDGLRAFSIISVLAGHTLRNYPSLLPYVDGGVGVQIFFLISGFLITMLLLKEKVKFGKVSYRNFYIRRALRIFPFAYLFLLILLTLNKFCGLGITRNEFLASAFYVKNFQWPADWYSGHFWSLSIEEQFYLLMPVLLISNTNRYILIICVLAVITPALDFVGFHNIGAFYTNKPLHMVTLGLADFLDKGGLDLFAGSLVCILIFKGIIKPERFKSTGFIGLFLFLVALVIHYLEIPFVSAICFTILMLWVLILCIGEENVLTKIFSTRILVKLGILSYSIYVWQQLFTVYQPWQRAFPYAGSPFLNLPLLLLVAWLSYTFYESYFLKLKGRFVKVADAENSGRTL